MTQIYIHEQINPKLEGAHEIAYLRQVKWLKHYYYYY